MIRPVAALALLATVALAACGSTSTPAPATPAPSVAPSQVPLASAVPPTPAPERHADATLEALLPETLGGVALVRESQAGTDLMAQSDALDAMLATFGKTIEDFTVASSYSPAGDIEAQIGAWRVAGVTGEKLLPEFIKAVQSSSATTLEVKDESIGGHDVTRIGAAGQLTQGPLYVYPHDDVVLFVQSTDPKLVEEALSKMP